MIGLLEVVALAGTILAMTTWLVVAFFAPGTEPAARRLRQEHHPGPKGSRARAWLYAPVWLPLALLGAAIAPGIVGELLQHGDHCLDHAAIHHHLCLLHPPHPADHTLTWVLPLIILIPAVAVVSICIRRAWREWQLTRTLTRLSTPSELGADVRLLQQDEPWALTVGWREPVILLSTGLVSRASHDTLAVVLAHERAHASRRDTVAALFDRLTAALLPRPVAEPLLERITLAREHACDCAAADTVGSPLKVAKALAEVVRLRVSSPAVGVSMASGAIEARARMMLAPPRRKHRWPLAALAVGIVLAAAGAGPVHWAVEHIIAFLVH